MYASIASAEEFVRGNPGIEITMVGHSKGGAEAAANAVATGTNCIVFNPATVNLEAYGLSASGYDGRTTAFIVKGDILNEAEGWFSAPIGKVKYLPQQYGGHWYQDFQTSLADMIANHMIGMVENALKEAWYL